MAILISTQFVACTTVGRVSTLAQMQAATAETPCEKRDASIVSSQRVRFTEGYRETLEFSNVNTGSDCRKDKSTCRKMIVTGGKFTREAESPARLIIDAGRTAAEATIAGGVWANKFRSRISSNASASQSQSQSQTMPLTPYNVQ